MRREFIYQPMGVRKEVSFDQMTQVLEKHAQRTGIPVPPPKAQTVVENPSPPCVQSGLEWCKPEKGATGVRTVCGRYSCSKVTVSGKQTYEVWRLVPNHWFKQIAIGLDSFETAKRVADEDFKQTPWAKSA
jgi:hypothetical protein